MNSTCVELSVDDTVRGFIIFSQIWAGGLCLVGSTGNILVILTIIHQLVLPSVSQRGGQMVSTVTNLDVKQNLRNRVFIKLEGDTVFLLHLFICDFLYSAINLPFTIVVYHRVLTNATCDLVNDPTLCEYAAFLRYFIAYTEWLTLALLMVERGIDISRFCRPKLFTPTVAAMSCIIIWITSAVSLLPDMKPIVSNFLLR